MWKFSTKNPYIHIFEMIQTICQKGMLEIRNGNVLFQLSFHIRVTWKQIFQAYWIFMEK